MNKYQKSLNTISDTLTYYMVRRDESLVHSDNEIYNAMAVLRKLVDNTDSPEEAPVSENNKWLDEKTCENLSDYNLCNQFECSNCGIVICEYQEVEVDENDGSEFIHEYTPKYCPNCGRKIVD